MKHTGPWTYEQSRVMPEITILADGRRRVGFLALNMMGDPKEADAARIVACVNALEGIDDVAAARTLLDDPRTAAATDMLAVLREILAANEPVQSEAMTRIREVIAKAEGRT